MRVGEAPGQAVDARDASGLVVYLVQNHRPPAQLARLVRALRQGSPGAFVLVVHDAHAGLAPTSAVADAVDAPVLEARERGRRGHFSLIAPYFDAVDWLASRDVDYDWLVYLSAQDYPVRPLAELEARLADEGADGYLRHWRAFSREVTGWHRHQGELRYRLQYRELTPAAAQIFGLFRFLNGWQRRVHLHRTYGARLGMRPRRSPWEPGFDCWAGTQWSALRRAAAEEVTARVRAGGPRIEWFRRTICPDEALVQTLLVAAGRFRLVDDDLRYCDFAGSRDGHPRMLGLGDLEAIVASGKPFARKLDLAAAPGLLDALDERTLPGSASAWHRDPVFASHPAV